ncbi:hypothetical protein HDU76_002500 [Blyttiomyces sp. JEL0837]|nr:hypothetical protein HDU76_002500 [Blyttiomyces sp. JEL0837]
MVLSKSFHAVLFLATTFTTIVISSPVPHTNATISFSRPSASVVWADEMPLGHRQVTTPNQIPDGCSLFDNSHLNIAERLPGWRTFLQIVANDLGVGVNSWSELHLGWDHFITATDGEQTYLCPDGSRVNWNWDLTNACVVNKNTDTFVGNDINVAYNANVKASLGTSVTVTHTLSNEFGLLFETGGKAGIPKVAEGEYRRKFSWKITSTDSEGTTDTKLVTQDITGSLPYQGGKTCYMDIELSVCRYSGSGNLPIIATGWVWFVFRDQVKGHWNWAYKIDHFLPDDNDRTYNSPVNADISSFGSGKTISTCDDGSFHTGPNTNLAAFPITQSLNFVYQVPPPSNYGPIFLTEGDQSNNMVLDFPQPPVAGTNLIINPQNLGSASQQFTLQIADDNFNYNIVHQQTGFCADAPTPSGGGAVLLNPCNNAASQKWSLQYTTLHGGGYDVINVQAKGMCLNDYYGQSKQGDVIRLNDCATGGQAWFIPKYLIPEIKYIVSLVGSQARVMEFNTTHGTPSAMGTPLTINIPDPGYASSQLFKFIPTGDGVNYFIHHLATGLCVDALGGSNGGNVSGASVGLWTCSPDAPNQMWSLRPSDVGVGYHVVGKQSGLCLNDWGGDRAVGDVIKLFDCASSGQAW